MLQDARTALERSQLLHPILRERILPVKSPSPPSFYPPHTCTLVLYTLEIKSWPETCNFPGRVCIQLFSYLHNNLPSRVSRTFSLKCLGCNTRTLDIPFNSIRKYTKSRGGVGLISKIRGRAKFERMKT